MFESLQTRWAAVPQDDVSSRPAGQEPQKEVQGTQRRLPTSVLPAVLFSLGAAALVVAGFRSAGDARTSASTDTSIGSSDALLRVLSQGGNATVASTTQKPGKEESPSEWELALPGNLCDFKFDISSATSPAAKCFCKLAGNAGCADTPCECPQGCSGTAWDHPRSVTFINLAKASNCHNGVATALLTIPRSYMRDIGYLKFWCARGAVSLMTEMIEEGFQSYQEEVRRGPVKQCIHAGVIASVPWFHLHTIGEGGVVDRMVETTDIVWCHNLKSADNAEHLAAQILEWAGGETVKALARRPMEPPSTCAVMECGTWGPFGHCSCVPECSQWGICCKDYEEKCFSEVHIRKKLRRLS